MNGVFLQYVLFNVFSVFSGVFCKVFQFLMVLFKRCCLKGVCQLCYSVFSVCCFRVFSHGVF